MSSLKDYAHAIVCGTTLDAKLRRPPVDLDDSNPGEPLFLDAPLRPSPLAIDYGRKVRVPPPKGMSDPEQRIRILHAHANHELQAIELFAWAILAFPEAPRAFRRGCLDILEDEQNHCLGYCDRLKELGSHFGDHPVTAHFWRRVGTFTSPLRFICAMGLTFENANLDFALELAGHAERVGDVKTRDLLRVVHDDEIRHVAFAWQWLKKWKRPDESPWDAYMANTMAPMGPRRARGKSLDRSSRVAAGFDAEFIARMEATVPTRPGGARR